MPTNLLPDDNSYLDLSIVLKLDQYITHNPRKIAIDLSVGQRQGHRGGSFTNLFPDDNFG